jgi:hypothetical protein
VQLLVNTQAMSYLNLKNVSLPLCFYFTLHLIDSYGYMLE